MLGRWKKRSARQASHEQQRRIERMGYRITDDGKVVCGTCGGWCGQCGDDHSADSVEAFERRMQSRN